MDEQMNRNSYDEYRAELLYRALEERRSIEHDGVQKSAQQSSALQALRCYSPETHVPGPSLSWSNAGHQWSKISGQHGSDFSQHLKHPASLTPFHKSSNDLETRISLLQTGRIPSPPFLLDHIENEDEFLYGKSELSPVHQTKITPDTSHGGENLQPVQKGTSDWSDDEDLFPGDSGLTRSTWKKPNERNVPGEVGTSRTRTIFDMFDESSAPETWGSMSKCDQDLSNTHVKSKMVPHDAYENGTKHALRQSTDSQEKNDFFGLISSSVSAPKPGRADISALLKNLKSIQMLQNQDECKNSEESDNVSDLLTPKPFIPIKSQIILNLKNKSPGIKSSPVLKQISDKSQLHETSAVHGASHNQSAAASLLVSQLFQKLSSKHRNQPVGQGKDSSSDPVASSKNSFGKTNNPGKLCKKEPLSMSVGGKIETAGVQEQLSRRSLKRNRSLDHSTVECHDSSNTKSLQKKSCPYSSNENELNEVSKPKEVLQGILKVRKQNFSSEDYSFDKNHGQNLSDKSPIRHFLGRSPKRQSSHERSSRRKSRSPKRRSPDRSPRHRSRSQKRNSPNRSPKRRSRSCKRRSPDGRSPRRKSVGRQSPKWRSPDRSSPRRRSRSRKRLSPAGSPRGQTWDRSPQRRSLDKSPHRRTPERTHQIVHDRSPQTGSHDTSFKKHLQDHNTSSKTCGKPMVNKTVEQSVPESSPSVNLLSKGSQLLSLEEKLNKSLQAFKHQRSVHSRGNSPLIITQGSNEGNATHDSLNRKDAHEKFTKADPNDIQKWQPVVSHRNRETVRHDFQTAPSFGEPSDGKATLNVASKKILKKLSETKVTSSTLKVLTSSEHTITEPNQLMLTSLAQQPPVSEAVESYPQYSEAHLHSYPPAYHQPSAYGDVAGASSYSYYNSAMPYASYHPTYDPSSYNPYTSQYPVDNHLQTENYMNYYPETLPPQNQIPVINPTPVSEEKLASKKIPAKKEFRRKSCLVQLDFADQDLSRKSEDKIEKKEKIDVKMERKDKSEKQNKTEMKDSVHPEGGITPEEEKELLSRRVEIKKQVENLNSEYSRISKLQGEMMRKMRREKDGHKDHIITAYGRLQDEIKVQLSSLSTALKDIDKELEKKVRSGRTKSEPLKKLSMLEKDGKKILAKPKVEEVPENSEFFDPGGHWCQNCNKLISTAYDMLAHLKSDEHKEHLDPLDKPWINKSLRKIRNRTEVDVNKSYPIKGVQFVMPVDGFYCSLCKMTFPDSTVAEDHIVGKEHNAAYRKLVTENPVYERRRILDRLAGVTIIQKEENKRRSEAEKELANKRKRQEDEISKRKEASKKKEEEKVKIPKHEMESKFEEKVEKLAVKKTDAEAEKKKAIKMALLESKKLRHKERSNSDENKPKQTVVYIGRAPNYKPRAPVNSNSKSLGGSASKEIKDCGAMRDSFMGKSDHFANQKEAKNDSELMKGVLLDKACKNDSGRKEWKDSNHNKDSLSISTECFKNASETTNIDLRIQHSCSSVSDTVKPVTHASTFTDVSASADSSGGELASDSAQMNSRADKMYVHEASQQANSDCSAGFPRSESDGPSDPFDDKSNYSVTNSLPLGTQGKQRKNVDSLPKITSGSKASKEVKKAIRIRGPLTEEESDLLLLGINKDDQMPIAIPKPPPSVMVSKSKPKQDGIQGKNTNPGKLQKNEENNVFLDELAKKAKEYAEYTENISVQSTVGCYQSLENVPYLSYQMYYYPTIPSSFHSSVANQIPSVQSSSSTTQADAVQLQSVNCVSAIPNASVQGHVSLAQGSYLPNVQSVTTVQADTSHQPSTTTVQTNISHQPSAVVAPESIALNPESTVSETSISQNSQQSVGTDGIIVPQLPTISSTSMHTDPPVQPPVSYSSNMSSNCEVQRTSLQKPDVSHSEIKSAPNEHFGILHVTEVCDPSLCDGSANQGNDFQSAQTISVPEENASFSPGFNIIEMQCDVSRPPPTVKKANNQNFSGTYQENISQQQFTPSVQCVSTIPANFSVPPPAGINENITCPPPAVHYSPNMITNAPLPVNDSNLNYSGNHNVSTVQGNISQANMNHSSIQNTSVVQMSTLNPPAANYVPTSPQKSPGLLGNVTQPPPNINYIANKGSPVTEKNVAPLSLVNFSVNIPSNPPVPGNISQPPPNMNFARPPGVTVVQGNMPRGNYNPAIPGVTSQENMPVHPPGNCPPNLGANLTLTANLSQPPPNINAHAPVIPLNVPQPPLNANLQGNHSVPSVPGNLSQPPPNIAHSGNQNSPIVPGNLSQPPPNVSHTINLSVPGGVPNPPPNVNHLGNPCAPIVLGNVSHPPPNIYQPGNGCVLGNVLHPPPNINHPNSPHAPAAQHNILQSPPKIIHHGNQHLPIILGDMSQPPPVMNLPGNHFRPGVQGNVPPPPGLQPAIPGQVNYQTSCVNYSSNIPSHPFNEQGSTVPLSPNFHPAVPNNPPGVQVNVPPSTVYGNVQNQPVTNAEAKASPQKEQNCLGSYGKSSGQGNAPHLLTYSVQSRPAVQENVQQPPPCMPHAPVSDNNHLVTRNVMQQPSSCGTPNVHCKLAIKENSPAASSVQSGNSAVGSTANEISTSTDSCITEGKSSLPAVVMKSKLNDSGPENTTQKMKNRCDVQMNKQEVSDVSVAGHEDNSSSLAASSSHVPLTRSTARFHPAPPGTEPVASLQPSCSQKSVNRGTANNQPHTAHCESSEVHKEREIEIKDKEFARSAAIESQVDRNIKPSTQITIPGVSLSSCPSHVDGKNVEVQEISNASEKTVQHPPAFTENKHGASDPKNIVQVQNRSCCKVLSYENSFHVTGDTVPSTQDVSLAFNSQNASSANKFPLQFGLSSAFQERHSDSPAISLDSSHERLARHVPSPLGVVTFNPAPPGTEPIAKIERYVEADLQLNIAKESTVSATQSEKSLGGVTCVSLSHLSSKVKESSKGELCNNYRDSDDVACHVPLSSNEASEPSVKTKVENFACSQSGNMCYSVPWSRSREFQEHSSIPPAPVITSLSDALKRQAPCSPDYFNLAPPGTEPVTIFHPFRGLCYENPKLMLETEKSTSVKKQDSSLAKSIQPTPERSQKTDGQVSVSKKSNISASVQQQVVCNGKLSTETTVSYSVVRAASSVGCTNGGKTSEYSRSAFIYQESPKLRKPQIAEVNIETVNGFSEIGTSSDCSSQQLYTSTKNSGSVRGVCQHSNTIEGENTLQQNHGIMKNETGKPINIIEKHSSCSDVQINARELRMCQPSGIALSVSQNSTAHSTENSSTHSVLPWFPMSSSLHFSSSPIMSMPLALHGTFAKHTFSSSSSDFLNPAPPGTEPIASFRPLSYPYHGGQEFTSRLSSGNKGLQGNSGSVCNKSELHLKADLQVTEKSDASTSQDSDGGDKKNVAQVAGKTIAMFHTYAPSTLLTGQNVSCSKLSGIHSAHRSGEKKLPILCANKNVSSTISSSSARDHGSSSLELLIRNYPDSPEASNFSHSDTDVVSSVSDLHCNSVVVVSNGQVSACNSTSESSSKPPSHKSLTDSNDVPLEKGNCSGNANVLRENQIANFCSNAGLPLTDQTVVNESKLSTSLRHPPHLLKQLYPESCSPEVSGEIVENTLCPTDNLRASQTGSSSLLAAESVHCTQHDTSLSVIGGSAVSTCASDLNSSSVGHHLELIDLGEAKCGTLSKIDYDNKSHFDKTSISISENSETLAWRCAQDTNPASSPAETGYVPSYTLSSSTIEYKVSEYEQARLTPVSVLDGGKAFKHTCENPKHSIPVSAYLPNWNYFSHGVIEKDLVFHATEENIAEEKCEIRTVNEPYAQKSQKCKLKNLELKPNNLQDHSSESASKPSSLTCEESEVPVQSSSTAESQESFQGAVCENQGDAPSRAHGEKLGEEDYRNLSAGGPDF